MTRSEFKHRLPGYIATGLVILTTTFWTFWGVAEMYYEGGGLPFPEPMRYLTLGAVCLALTLVALTWPRFGGWVLILIGGAFTAWWWMVAAARGWLSLGWIVSTFPATGLLILTGVLFLLEGRYRQRLRAEGWTPPKKWVRRKLALRPGHRLSAAGGYCRLSLLCPYAPDPRGRRRPGRTPD